MAALPPCEFCIGRECACAPMSPGQRAKAVMKLAVDFCENDAKSVRAFIGSLGEKGWEHLPSPLLSHPELVGPYPPGLDARLCAVIAVWAWAFRAPYDLQRAREVRSTFVKLHHRVVAAMFDSEPIFREELVCVLAYYARLLIQDQFMFADQLPLLREATKNVGNIQWRMLCNLAYASPATDNKHAMRSVENLFYKPRCPDIPEDADSLRAVVEQERCRALKAKKREQGPVVCYLHKA